MVNIKRYPDVSEELSSAAFDDDCGRAVLADEIQVMRCYYVSATGALSEQLFFALAPEYCVTNGNDLVDQVTIKLNCERQPEGKPCAHARGIVSYWHFQRTTKFRKGFDSTQKGIWFASIDSGKKADVVKASHPALEGSAKAQGPRGAHAPSDVSGGRPKNASEDLDQRRFSLAIAAKNREPAVPGHSE
jgi:hypothetical protein